MITIKLSEIKKFMSAAKHIVDSKIIPIYSYIKLVCEGEATTLYKTNGTSFVSCDIKSEFKENQVILIEEKTLSGSVEGCSGDEIKIEVKNDKVVISDNQKTTSCQSIEDNFPNFDKPGTGTMINQEVLSALYIARSHADIQKEMMNWQCFVHIVKSGKLHYVLGFNGIICYTKSFKDALPALTLDPRTVSIISEFPQLSYSEVGNYDFFDSGSTCYGFVKSEIKAPDISPVLKKMESDNKLVVERKEIMNFCDHVLRINNTALPPIVSISESGKKNVKLRFDNAAGNQESEVLVPVEKKSYKLEPFAFLPKQMSTALKDLGVGTVNLSYVDKNFILTSEEDPSYIGAIMEIVQH